MSCATLTDHLSPQKNKGGDVIPNVKRIIKALKGKFNKSTIYLKDLSTFLPTYHLSNEVIDIYFNGRSSPIRLLKFINKQVELDKNFGVKVYIEKEDGEVIPFLIQSCIPFNYDGENKVNQLFELLNPILNGIRGTAKGHLKLHSQETLFFNPRSRIVAVNESSSTLLDICSERSKKIIAAFHKCVYSSKIDEISRENLKCKFLNVFPTNILEEWCNTYHRSSSSSIRNQFSEEFASINIVKYLFCLTDLNPDMINIDFPTGCVTIFGLQFEIEEMLVNRKSRSLSVPFRLTPNISNFITEAGLEGSFKEHMVLITRSFHKHSEYIRFLICAVLMGHPYFQNKKGKKKLFEAANIIIEEIKDLSEGPISGGIILDCTKQNLEKFLHEKEPEVSDSQCSVEISEKCSVSSKMSASDSINCNQKSNSEQEESKTSKPQFIEGTSEKIAKLIKTSKSPNNIQSHPAFWFPFRGYI